MAPSALPHEGVTPQSIRPVRCSDRANPTYPFDFSILKEGEDEPLLGKKIDSLISSDEDYIVFLDDDCFVWWDMNENVLLDDQGVGLTRVAVLESIQVGDYLTRPQIETFRRLVGEAVARLFENNEKAASLSFEKAEDWIRARNREHSRLWYLSGATLVAIPMTIAVGWLILQRADFRPYLGSSVFNVAIGAAIGAVGAWLSVVQRARRTDLDVSAGRTLHYIEGSTRVLVGVVGAFLLALGTEARLLLSYVQETNAFATLLVFCVVAGFSERLIPSFVEGLEATSGHRPLGETGGENP
jgi:hypothetical protein